MPPSPSASGANARFFPRRTSRRGAAQRTNTRNPALSKPNWFPTSWPMLSNVIAMPANARNGRAAGGGAQRQPAGRQDQVDESGRLLRLLGGLPVCLLHPFAERALDFCLSLLELGESDLPGGEGPQELILLGPMGGVLVPVRRPGPG